MRSSVRRSNSGFIAERISFRSPWGLSVLPYYSLGVAHLDKRECVAA